MSGSDKFKRYLGVRRMGGAVCAEFVCTATEGRERYNDAQLEEMYTSPESDLSPSDNIRVLLALSDIECAYGAA